VRNHVRSVLACDFFVAVTATFRRRLRVRGHGGGHAPNRTLEVTAHPTADWTAQQFRMIVSGDQPHRYVIHDRDQHLFGGRGSDGGGDGFNGAPNASSGTSGERILRKIGGNDPPRMFGFRDSAQ